MNRSTVKVLILVSKNKKIKTRKIAEILGLSYARVLQILKELNRIGLVKLSRGKVEAVPLLSDLILKVNEKYPLEEIFTGSIPIILSKLMEPKTVNEISILTGFSEKYIARVLNKLAIRGIIIREGNTCVLVNDPLIRVFIMQIAKVIEGVEPEAKVIYRDNYYIIKELPKEHPCSGTPTAFSAFHKYGIQIETNREICIFPPKKLELEEVLVHSLLASKTKTEYTLTALLYAKYYYEINHTKLFFYAKWFRQTEKLFRLENYIHGTEDPLFLSWSDLKELAEMYNIDLSPFKRRQFNEKVFAEIGSNLESKIVAILFGGAEMVIKNYKISTKDIDISFPNRESMEIFIKTITRLGYKKKSEDDTIVFEHKNMSRIDIFLEKIGKLKITRGILERSQKREYKNLELLLISDTDLLLTKLVSARPRDIEDAKIIIRKGNVDWKILLDELLKQEEITKHHYCLLILTELEEIEKQLKIRIPYKRKLLHITTEHMVEYAYREYGLTNPRDIKRLINVSEETIRKILKKLKQKNPPESIHEQ